MTDRYDVVVVGAGPAGCVAALTLARAGLSTALLERGRLPREKVCGDGLIPDAIQLLEEIGLWESVRPAGHPVARCRVYAPDGSHVDLTGTFLTTRRRDLDALLARSAASAGAVLRDETGVTGWIVEADGVALHALRRRKEETVRARMVILACGAHAPTLRRFGLLTREAPSAVALRAYYRLRPGVDSSMLRVWYERALLPGYGWMFPLGRDVFNVGVGVFRNGGDGPRNAQRVLQGFLSRCESARALLAGGEALGPFRGAPMRTGLTGARRSDERLLACGECIGTTYPFSGEGTGKAMQTARLAAQVATSALGSDDLSARALGRYDDLVERRFGVSYRHYEVAQKWLRWPWVCNLVASRARSRPSVRGILEDVLSERQRPTEILSLAGLLRALVSP
jgi:geranylgeranyl reductase family protein